MKTKLATAVVTLLASGPLFAQQSLELKTKPMSNQSAKASLDSSFKGDRKSEKAKTSMDLSVASRKDSSKPELEKSNSRAASAESSARRGGADPGGQGSMRVNGQLKTMAEALRGAGVIFDQAAKLGSKVYPKYYPISSAAREELDKLLEKLPGNNILSAHYILGKDDRSVFIDQTSKAEISATDYNKIKVDYTKVVRSFGKKLDPSAFVLAAYAKNEKTYFLPAFEDHKPEQQALILVHEYFMRQEYGKKETVAQRLARVLTLDSAILEIRDKGQSDEANLNFYGAVSKLNADYYTGTEEAQQKWAGLKLHTLATELEQLGHPLLLSQLVLKPENVLWREEGREKMDPSLIQNFERVVPGIAESFENWTVDKTGAGFDGLKLPQDQEHFNRICRKFAIQLKQSTVSSDMIVAMSSDGFARVFKCSGAEMVKYDVSENTALINGKLGFSRN